MNVRCLAAGAETAASERRQRAASTQFGEVLETPVEMVSARPVSLSQDNELEVATTGGPAANVCYYRPEGSPSGESVALDMLAEVLSGARTARMYQGLVLPGAAPSK